MTALAFTGALQQMQGAVSRIFDSSSSTAKQFKDPRSICTPRMHHPTNRYVAEDKTMTCNERLKLAISNIEGCPEAKKILDKVDAMNPICFICVPTQHAPYGAKFWLHNRTITIPNDQVSEQPGASLLLFELHHAEKESKSLSADFLICYAIPFSRFLIIQTSPNYLIRLRSP
jgi:hypothetical protein